MNYITKFGNVKMVMKNKAKNNTIFVSGAGWTANCWETHGSSYRSGTPFVKAQGLAK